ncbi:IS1096 element passenger TnpR family protein [Rhizobium tibeticum]|uniref:IS1096 element passenger TnpR family protein n=1 Tax=Rhizobium tibeticum TaxID=501024 RepID=UPI000931322B|nr:hypothetical protein [Rhizobium tibeticum]
MVCCRPSETSLLDVGEDVGTKTIHYIYDFGDNWHHVIKAEKFNEAMPRAEPASRQSHRCCPAEHRRQLCLPPRGVAAQTLDHHSMIR